MGVQGYLVNEVLLEFQDHGILLVLLHPPQHVLEHTHCILIGGELQEVLIGNLIKVDGLLQGEYFYQLLDEVSGDGIET